MPSSDKNKSGGHSHPQNDDNNKGKGDTPRTEEAHGDVLPSGEKVKSHQGAKESFGSSGPKDNH